MPPSADEPTVAELADRNREYEAKHGFIFIVCASGRTRRCDARASCARGSATIRADELRTAAEEQAKITRLRLAKLLGEIA